MANYVTFHYNVTYRLAQQQQQQRQNAPDAASADSFLRGGPFSNLQQGDAQGTSSFQQGDDMRQSAPIHSGTIISSELEDIKSPRSAGALSGSPPFSPSDQDLHAWLSQKDLGDLGGCNVDLDELELMDEDLVELPTNNNNPDGKVDSRIRTSSVNSDINRHSPPDSLELESKELLITMSAEELQRRCKNEGADVTKVIKCNILGDHAPPPAPPNPPIVSSHFSKESFDLIFKLANNYFADPTA